MKKTRKMTKSDVVYKLIGQAAVIVLFHVGGIALFIGVFDKLKVGQKIMIL